MDTRPQIHAYWELKSLLRISRGFRFRENNWWRSIFCLERFDHSHRSWHATSETGYYLLNSRTYESGYTLNAYEERGERRRKPFAPSSLFSSTKAFLAPAFMSDTFVQLKRACVYHLFKDGCTHTEQTNDAEVLQHIPARRVARRGEGTPSRWQ